MPWLQTKTHHMNMLMEEMRDRNETTLNLVQIRHNMERSVTGPIVLALTKTGITPNTLTIIGFLITLIAAILIGMGHFISGGITILIAGVFDMLDGTLARSKKQETRFGAFLDSVLDRFSEAVLLLGILIISLQRNLVPEIILVFVVLTGSMMTSYVRARAEGLGWKGKAGWFTRPERVIVLAIGVITQQIFVALILMAVFIIITVIQRITDVHKEAREKRNPE